MADAAAAAAPDPRAMRMRALHDKCLQMEARSVPPLSLKDPEGDWRRWSQDATAVALAAGQDF
eukprot:11689989-Alexandrium_andersonii.AAC.1